MFPSLAILVTNKPHEPHDYLICTINQILALNIYIIDIITKDKLLLSRLNITLYKEYES